MTRLRRGTHVMDTEMDPAYNPPSASLTPLVQAAPQWAHHLLTAFLTGEPLNFRGEVVPADIIERLDRAKADGTLRGVPPERIK